MIKMTSPPVEDFKISEVVGGALYGDRIHPIYKVKRKHEGIDIRRPKGTPVRATADGTVLISKMQGDGKGYGNYIVVKHSKDSYSIYAHLSKRLVAACQLVKDGQKIGEVGSTGDSTGPHLHYGICADFPRANGTDRGWTDPLLILKGVSIMAEHWGMASLKSLVDKKIIKNPEKHKDTLDEPLTKAEVFALIDRITDEK